jgi:osmotically-inducible protein OsmY
MKHRYFNIGTLLVASVHQGKTTGFWRGDVMTESILRYCGLVAAALYLTACDPVSIAIGGGAVVGTTAVRNEKGVIGSVSDAELQAKINHSLFKKDRNIFDRTELCVKHGTVVAIGYMANQAQRERALSLIKGAADERKVYDEISIGNYPDTKCVATDFGITARIKSALAFDGNVQSLNYDVTTVKGIVYICGTAQNAFERDVVLNHARTTSSVKQVVSYIRTLGKDKKAA